MRCFVMPQTQVMYAVINARGEVRPDGFGPTATQSREQFIARHRLTPALFDLAGYRVKKMTENGGL